MSMAEEDMGVWAEELDMFRRSCVWAEWWIIDPAQMNRRALNRACEIRWRNVRDGSPIPRVDNITPSCLRVERAITFLRSDSTMADRPAISMVRAAVRRREGRKNCLEDRSG